MDIPFHIIGHFLHLKGEEDEEEQVWDDQVKEEDVDGCRLSPDLAAERVEGQDVGREAGDEGDDVDGETQIIITGLHGCCVPYSPQEKEPSAELDISVLEIWCSVKIMKNVSNIDQGCPILLLVWSLNTLAWKFLAILKILSH